MEPKQWELEEIKIENSNAFRRIESLYLALNDLEAFERALLEGRKELPRVANPAPSLTTGA